MIQTVLLLAVALLASGCARPKLEGNYRDADNPAVTYEFKKDGTWRADLAAEVPAGVFPHGAGRKLEGTFRRRGDVVEMVCTSVTRQDPMSGEFRPEPDAPSAFNHRLRQDKEMLVPVGDDGETESLFPSDLNPLGARVLVRVGD